MKQESPQVETSSRIKPDYPDELDKLKQKFQKKHGTNFDQYYIAHPNIKLLYCYLFFSFAPIDAYKFKKLHVILNKMMGIQSSQQIQHEKITNLQEKFSLDWQKGNFIEHTLQKKSNSIVMNKKLLEELSQKLTEDDCKKLIISGLGKQKINIALLNEKPKSNLHITIVQTDKMAYIVFYQLTESQKKRDKSEIKSQIVESQIKPDGKQKVQRQNNEPERQQKVQRQNNQPQNKQKVLRQNNEPEKKKQRPMRQTKLKASKSVGSEIEQPPKISEKKDITWYEVAIILIIIFALAAEHTALFDDFLVQYNEHMGHYYVLDVGYKLNNFFFPANQ